VWAAGYRSQNDGDGVRPLVAHWDGSDWSIVPTQEPPSVDEESAAVLSDVVALGPDDAWTVGYADGDTNTPLVEHWDGSAWSIPTTTTPGGSWNWLRSAARVPRLGTLWSVGDYRDDLGRSRPLIQRYKDGEWTRVAEPPVVGGALAGVTAQAWDDVWAVGSSGYADGSALTLHRNGSTWKRVPSPPSPVAGGYARLSSVSAVSANDIWAVGHLDGYRDVGSSGNFRGSLLQHWDGSSWSIVPTPIDDPTAVLNDVAMRPSGYGWSVGTRALFSDGVLLQHCPA
jgi:hypothetical protein